MKDRFHKFIQIYDKMKEMNEHEQFLQQIAKNIKKNTVHKINEDLTTVTPEFLTEEPSPKADHFDVVCIDFT